jgi:hypothetical protein
MAVSGDQRNASASACEGVLKPRVCRGRPLSSGSRTHHGSTSSGLLMLTGSPFRFLQLPNMEVAVITGSADRR